MAKQDRHGSVTLYRRGCRCEKCRMAQRDKMRKYRADAKAQDRQETKDCGLGRSKRDEASKKPCHRQGW
jgi:hypothetical protein